MTGPNHSPFKKRHLVYAAAVLGGAAAFAHFATKGEGNTSAAPADNGEPVPAASAPLVVPTETSPTPSPAASSKSPSPTPSAERSTVAPMPTTGETESPNDPQKAQRERIARWYVSCRTASVTNGGKEDGDHIFTVSATYQRDPKSAQERAKKPDDIDWQYPDLVPVGIGKDGKPNGMTYSNRSNESEFDETDPDTFRLPIEDSDKGDRVVIGAQTTATGLDGDGRYVTTTVTTICEDTPAFVFNGSDWKFVAEPAPAPVYGPHVETTVG